MDAHGEKRKEQQLISISSISAGIRQGLSRDGVKANLPLPGKGVLRAAALLSCLSVHLRAASGNLTARSHTFLTVCLFVDGGGLQVKGFGGEKRTLFPSSCPTDRKEPGKAERSSWDQERALRGRLWTGRHPGPGGCAVTAVRDAGGMDRGGLPCSGAKGKHRGAEGEKGKSVKGK